MNLQQLEYIIAVDKHRHFVKAAEDCFVTQATLSMMIKKLEEEIGVRIFDRTKKPVIPTEIGERIIAQAKIVVRGSVRIAEMVAEERGEFSGELRIGIIPTLAPYLLPLFLRSFLRKYPRVKLQISELTTSEIVRKLEQYDLDAGILATPLNNSGLNEEPLFYEEFVVYVSDNEPVMQKKYVLADEIDIDRLWLLEEGHCLRSQVVNLCELRNRKQENTQLEFSAGSIETLKKLVQTNQGITVLPQLALKDLSRKERENVRFFHKPVPVREIGLVTYRYFIREKLVNALRDELLSGVPAYMKVQNDRQVLDI